jgi:hypothetical protein
MRTATIIILVVLVLVSLFYLGYNQPKKEGFTNNDLTDFANLLKDMLNNPMPTGSDTGANSELQNQIKTLNERLLALIALGGVNAQSEPSTEDAPLPEINALNDAQLLQLKQDATINELKRRLANLQKIYSSYLQKQSETAVRYDKIPVYSSCIVSEADGRYTLPTPAV